MRVEDEVRKWVAAEVRSRIAASPPEDTTDAVIDVWHQTCQDIANEIERHVL